MNNQTLILVKPDGVARGLIGNIFSRLERAGLKLVALKMLKPSRELADRHYALTEEWMLGVFTKAKEKYEATGVVFPYSNHQAYGKFIKDGLVEFLASGPIVAAVVEGEQAAPLVRKLVGATEPASAAPGTIRGDLSLDTYALSNTQRRPLRNLIHASGDAEEAAREIAIWFTPQELLQYEAALDSVQYDETKFR